MHYDLLVILVLLFTVFMLVMTAEKLKISYPIFLVIAGLIISFIPGIPHLKLEPDTIFLIFLPPLLYEAAWYTSWNQFWKWRRPIGMLAFGLVFITSIIIALVSNAMIPGFTLALGFLLGGIVSPPDAVAATSILRNIKVPERITTILEGESLINDASSLIVFRFALAAVLTGQFSMGDAIGDFFLVVLGGIAVGLAIAFFMYWIHHYLPTTPTIDSALTLLTPYCMYLAAEQFHFSGVMAVVCGGLFLSYRSHQILSHSDSRLIAWGLWETVVFVLNGLVFILIGLELPEIVDDLNDGSIPMAIFYGLVISAIAIVTRILWTFPIAYVPKWLGQKVRMDPTNPTWKGPAIISWAGMRGVVSLASALSVPLFLENGQQFPHRSLILFITFIVILVTLVFQGLTLKWLIRKIDMKPIPDFPPSEEQEAQIRIRLLKASLEHLNKNYPELIGKNVLVASLKKQLEDEISEISERLESLEGDTALRDEIEEYHKVMVDIFSVQREELFQIRREKKFSDEEIRKQEDQIDFEEAKVLEE